MLAPISFAVVPRPGKFLGQHVIIFQRLRPFDIAGAGKVDVAASAPTAPPVKNDRRLIPISFSFVALYKYQNSGRFDVDLFPDGEQFIKLEEIPAPVLPEKGVI